MQVKTL